jgi:hypothetical protein
MQYFSILPKIIKTDSFGNSILMINLMARASVIPSLLQNPANYYPYDIQDGDTPEIVAHKYYGDVYRYWIVLFSNQILDPQWQWPLNSNEFQNYLIAKYPSTNIYSEAYSYEKIITQFDFNTNTTTVNTVKISQETYNSFIASTTTVNLPTGTVSISTSAKKVSIFENELNLNESNRNIKLIKSSYVNQLETQLKTLMSQ